jgi:hypothetical protein
MKCQNNLEYLERACSPLRMRQVFVEMSGRPPKNGKEDKYVTHALACNAEQPLAAEVCAKAVRAGRSKKAGGSVRGLPLRWPLDDVFDHTEPPNTRPCIISRTDLCTASTPHRINLKNAVITQSTMDE